MSQFTGKFTKRKRVLLVSDNENKWACPQWRFVELLTFIQNHEHYEPKK